MPGGFVEQLNRIGAAVVDDVCSGADLPVLRREFDRVMEEGGGRAGARNSLSRSAALGDVARSTAVLRLVETVLGPEAFLSRALLFDKRQGANWDVIWHRDTTIAVREKRDTSGYGPWSVKSDVYHVRPPRRVLDGMLTIRLHLDDCDERNGALLVVAGSHRGLTDADLGRSPDAVECHAQAIACSVRAGGALVMRPLILHASKRALDAGRRRRVLHLEFASAPLDGGLQWIDPFETPAVSLTRAEEP